jgi:hypothetical protein
LAQGDEPVANIYSYILSRVNGRGVDIHPDFELQSSPSRGTMIYPISLDDSVLYIFVSDDAQDQEMKIRDNSTGVPISFKLPSEHAALVLIGKKEKAVIAKYGF